MVPTDVGQRRYDDLGVYKRSYRRWQYYVSMISGWLGVVFLLLLTLAPGTTDDPNPPGLRVTWAVLAVAVAWVMLRTVRMCVVIREDGVVIRNTIRSHHLRWSEIDHVSRPAGYGKRFKSGVKFHLRDGRVVTADAFTTALFDADDPAAEVEAAVTRRLAIYRATTPSD